MAVEQLLRDHWTGTAPSLVADRLDTWAVLPATQARDRKVCRFCARRNWLAERVAGFAQSDLSGQRAIRCADAEARRRGGFGRSSASATPIAGAEFGLLSREARRPSQGHGARLSIWGLFDEASSRVLRSALRYG